LARRDKGRAPSARCHTEEPLSGRRCAEQPLSVRRNGKARSASFVPVHVTDDPAWGGDGQIKIVLTDGRRVRVTGTVNRSMLARVLDVLTSTSAVELEGHAC